ncbi:MAG: PIN domain-containing protein [Treponema sp.]|nr:PIN domain-containing protein [Treponema sp.]
MKYYAVIDTNVIVSAVMAFNKSNEESSPYIILANVLAGRVIPLFSSEIIDEYKDVLSRKKFKFDVKLVNTLIEAIKKHGIDTKKADIDEILPDPKDVVFYQVTLEGQKSQNTYLVTGNLKHFPSKPFVVSPKQMIDIMLKDEADELFRNINRDIDLNNRSR